MSPRDWRLRLEDILDAIRNTRAYMRGMTFPDFAADLKTIRAAACEIGIIGAAASRISVEVRTRYPDLPWDKMPAV